MHVVSVVERAVCQVVWMTQVQIQTENPKYRDGGFEQPAQATK